MPTPHRRLLALLSCVLLGSPVLATVHYVRRDAGAGGDGTSWATAFQQVQDALAIAQAGDQVWVSKGTYRPGTFASAPTSRFEILHSTTLYGGFAGDETTLDQRDWVANETVLSGDLHLDDGPGFANRSDNCRHVVWVAAGLMVQSTIDGFTIRGGNATGTQVDSRGGGVYNFGNHLTLRHCVLADNEASGTGGALYGVDGRTIFDRCTVRGNRAAGGSAVYLFADGDFIGSLIQGNVSPSGGTAVTVQDGTSTFTNVAIAFNTGSGLVTCCAHNETQFKNSILWGNTGTQFSDFTGGSTQSSVVQGGAYGGLDIDPSFVDPFGLDGVAGTGDEDFRLSCVSPLIDRGSNALTAGATLDLAGNPRFVEDPATPDQGVGTAPIVDIGPYEFACGCEGVESYCTALPNTSGLPAEIGWSGSTSIFANAFTLHVSQGPPLKNGLFYYGPLEAAVPWGDGIRCVGGSLQRLSVIQLDANGEASFPLDFSQAPAGSGPHQLFPGDTSNFQFYFRDPLGGPAGWNYSDALSVAFCP